MDLHRQPFDEGTITKLEIFEAYTKEWLPVFVMIPYHLIYFEGPSPLVTYEQVFKNQRIITYIEK